jgi:hypothetical protein
MRKAHEFLSGPIIDLGDDYQFKLVVDMGERQEGPRAPKNLVQLDSRHFPVSEIASIQASSGQFLSDRNYVIVNLRPIWDYSFPMDTKYYFDNIDPLVTTK